MNQTHKLFSIAPIADHYEDVDAAHGRIETRRCTVINDLKFLDGQEKWPDLNCIIKIESERIIKQDSKKECETRYYISSCKPDAQFLNRVIRSHWHVENILHWVLDVNFNEDYARRRKGNSAQNFNLLTKMAMAFLKNGEINRNTSLKLNRYKAAMKPIFREQLLNLLMRLP